MAISLNGLGTVALHRGELLASREYHGRSLAIQRELGDRPGALESLLSISVAAATGRDLEEARKFLQEALVLHREVRGWYASVSAVDACLVLASSEADPERVLRLAGLGRAHRTAWNTPRTPVDERRIGGLVALAENALGSDRAAAAILAGATLAIDDVLSESTRAMPAAVSPLPS
jgi:hypothetical protein